MNLNCLFIIFLNSLIFANAFMKFTNIKCNEFDTPFATFDKCYLKLVQRGTVGLNIHVKLFQIPVTNVSINLALFRKYSGYRLFMYNVTADFCKFTANRKRNAFLKIFFDLLLKDSNLNHSCPYDHDIIVHNMILEDSMLRLLPLPTGEYMFQVKFAAYNDWKADVKAYFLREE